jgi:hypothetical protein
MFCICGRKGKELWRRTGLLRPTTAFHFLSPSHWSKWLSSLHLVPCNSTDLLTPYTSALEIEAKFYTEAKFLVYKTAVSQLRRPQSEHSSPLEASERVMFHMTMILLFWVFAPCWCCRCCRRFRRYRVDLSPFLLQPCLLAWTTS